HLAANSHGSHEPPVDVLLAALGDRRVPEVHLVPPKLHTRIRPRVPPAQSSWLALHRPFARSGRRTRRKSFSRVPRFRQKTLAGRPTLQVGLVAEPELSLTIKCRICAMSAT